MSVGDKSAAQTYFDTTRELAVIIYTEHIAAKLELARLKGEESAATATSAPRQATPRRPPTPAGSASPPPR
ncbi:hypothetical protein [Bradyrhizobium sp. BR13661]|jgi:hypothetical protein|uniref:hypothetical protein n=1 Tax=Bradyrhizobium sp. BR13661 TaxID=2940622 RepID=UPI0024730507|nr:hypothetical protein [Bradyrhizobium sp. BR13661]MDH6257745.1 hypothetical protein [Bradyrhizobium sp. BR13661]